MANKLISDTRQQAEDSTGSTARRSNAVAEIKVYLLSGSSLR
ncbi:hypothetical protein HMPREF9370_0546 [Neisseria wadsworthii 9715]|uniref:Uncharacterized protein n=1 Tax=Neisseria wadsworthii 9715 TaxID=1030841 RepID=G4CN87_9NEIS|nr:hypothetical protein HMPREF9370_0546 [Neisseria wadsworthii 9715]